MDPLRINILVSAARQRLKCSSLQKFGERAFKAWYFKFSFALYNDVNDGGSVDKIVCLYVSTYTVPLHTSFWLSKR